LLPTRPVVPVATLPLEREREAPPSSETEGNSEARCSRTSARACA
jgi:hypothetical protein